MEKEFIPYEQALELKELNFDEECFGEWQNLKTGKNLSINQDEDSYVYNIPVLGANISAPLYQQAFRWFREKYGLVGWIEGNEGKRMFMYRIESPIDSDDQLNCSPFKTYEEAELACIKKLIEIVIQHEL